MTNRIPDLSATYPDCMQGPSEPCAGYAQLLNRAEAHRREAERLRSEIVKFSDECMGLEDAEWVRSALGRILGTVRS